MDPEIIGVGREEHIGGGEEEYEIDPIFDYECIMIVANALRTPIEPYYGEKMTGGQPGKKDEEDEDPHEFSQEQLENATDILNRAAETQGSTATRVRVRRGMRVVRGQRAVGQRRPRTSQEDEMRAGKLLLNAIGKRLREESPDAVESYVRKRNPATVHPDPQAARDYAMEAAGGVLGSDVRRIFINAVNTILTAPGALARFYERYQRYINYGINFIGLTDLTRPNSIIVATITALIQTIAEFIPTPTDALGGLLNTGVNVATILYNGLPLLIPGLIAYGCATAGEALVHGTIRGVRRAATDPLGVARDVAGRAADVRDVVARLIAQGPRLFFGNLAVGAFNALMENIDPDGRFHRLEPRPVHIRAPIGPGIQAHLEEIMGRAPEPAAAAEAAAAVAAPGMRPVLDAVMLVPPRLPEPDIRERIGELLERPLLQPAAAEPGGGPVGITQEERDALMALLELADNVYTPIQDGSSKKRKYKTAKNKRKTPRRKRMSKKNLRRRY